MNPPRLQGVMPRILHKVTHSQRASSLTVMQQLEFSTISPPVIVVNSVSYDRAPARVIILYVQIVFHVTLFRIISHCVRFSEILHDYRALFRNMWLYVTVVATL